MAISYRDKWDKRISWALMWSFIGNALNYFIKSIFPLSSSMWNLLSLVIAVTILAAYVLCLREVWKRVSQVLVYSVLIFGVIYGISILLSFLRGEPINIIQESARSTYLFYIPAGVFAVAVIDKSILYRIMLKASYLLSAMMLFRVFVNYNPLYASVEGYEYSMSFGYIIIVPTLLHFHEFLRSRRTVLFFLFIIELFAIILYASRGVLLSVFAIVIYESLLGMKRGPKKTFFIILMSGLAVGYLQFGDSLLNSTLGALESRGLQSRTLYMLSQDAIDSDSGRDYLYKLSYKMIGEKPLLGWGVGGECYEFNKYLHNDEANIACTSHNGILQAMVQLGIPLGLLLSFLIILPIFKARKIPDDYLRSIIVVYFCAYAVPCVTFSSGFLVQPQIAIYMYLYYISYKKQKNK